MRSLAQRLKAPFFLNVSLWFRFRQAIFFSVFVFVFLFVFKPFGLNAENAALLSISANFAVLTFVVMLVLNMLVPFSFPGFFKEEKWTVGRELLWSFLNVSVIGLGNAMFAFERFEQPVSLFAILIYELYTLGVALFPISLSVLIKEARAKKKFETESTQLNTELTVHLHSHSPESTVLMLQSENANESLRISADAILFIASADNYVEVHFLEERQLKRKLLRNSLRAIAAQTTSAQSFWRCHKSYLVNLDRVVKTSGNAQGYKLHFLETDQSIPVSRAFNTELKQRLSN